MNPPNHFLEGKSPGQWIAEGLQEFADALQHDPKSIPKEFTCHTLVLDLRPTLYTAELVKNVRETLGASQAVFARFIGVAPNTVRAWEQGVNVPRDSACRLMDEIRHDPEYWRRRLRELATQKRSGKTVPRRASAGQ